MGGFPGVGKGGPAMAELEQLMGGQGGPGLPR